MQIIYPQRRQGGRVLCDAELELCSTVVIADEVDRILIEDLPIIRGKAGIGERKGVVVNAVAEKDVWAVAIRADAVVSIALDQLRGHDFSTCLDMPMDRGKYEARGVS